MINFELDNTKEGINIFVNKEGVEELIRYLNYIKEKEDHIHLLVGNDLSSEVIQEGSFLVKQVKIVFLNGPSLEMVS